MVVCFDMPCNYRPKSAGSLGHAQAPHDPKQDKRLHCCNFFLTPTNNDSCSATVNGEGGEINMVVTLTRTHYTAYVNTEDLWCFEI